MATQYDHLLIWSLCETINNNTELSPLSFTAHYWPRVPWGLSDATGLCLSAISLQRSSTESLLIAPCGRQLHSWRPLLPPSSSSPGMKRDLSCCQTVPAPHRSIRKWSAVTGEMLRTETLMEVQWWMHWLPTVCVILYPFHHDATDRRVRQHARLLWESESIPKKLS